jgi:transposase
VGLGQRWGLAVRRNTLLRLLRQRPVPSSPPPTVLGVDDFALRKRHTYGTILVDLERRQPVALLPDRTADTVAPWLREHPGVQGIARDRAQASAAGARQGAPTATPVAARVHLLQHLRAALDQVGSTHRQALDAVKETRRQQRVPWPDGGLAVPVPPHDIPLPTPQRAAPRQARRQTLHEPIWVLHRDGGPARAMAPHVGLRLRTGQRALRSATLTGRPRRSDHGDRLLHPYQPSLRARWHAGCSTARRRLRDLPPHGDPGSAGPVAASARRVRPAQGLSPGQRRPRHALPRVAAPPCPPLTPRRATRTEAEAPQRAQVRAQDAEVAAAIDLTQDCATRVRQRHPASLEPWRHRATTSPREAWRRCATGLYEADEAVKAGVTLPWRTGPVAGHRHRLTMRQRQRCGRARLALLSRRFVGAPREGAGPGRRPT